MDTYWHIAVPADQNITRSEEEKVEKYQEILALKSEGFMEHRKSQ